MEPVNKSGRPRPRFITSTISLGAYSAMNMVLALVGTILLTRYLSTDDFGVLTLLTVIVGFLTQFSTLALETSLPRYIAAAPTEESKEEYFGTALIMRLVTIVLTSVFALVGGPVLKRLFGTAVLPEFILYIPLLLATYSFRSLLVSTLQGLMLFNRMGLSDTVATLTKLLLYVVLVVFVRGDLVSFVRADVIGSLAGCAFAAFSVPLWKHMRFRWGTLREVLRFGWPLQVNSMLHFIFQRVDSIVVVAFLGPGQLALYEIAKKIPYSLRNLYGPFDSVYYPILANRYEREGKERAARFLNDAVRFVSFVTLFGAAIALLFGREILSLLFSEKYAAAEPIFVVLMINLSLIVITNVLGTSIVATGDPAKPMIINSFNALFTWVGSVLLVPLYALMGAALANTIGTFVTLPLNKFFLQKRINLHDASYLKPLLLFSALWLAVFILRPGSLLVRIGLLTAFIALSFLFSIVTKDDILLFAQGITPRFSLPLQKMMAWLSRW